MLNINTVKEGNLIFPKIEISQKSKQDIFNPKKMDEKEEENYDSDINTANKTSHNSSSGSNCDSINENNQEKLNDLSNSFNEEKNITSSKDINKNKNLFPAIDYFLCNEKYFRQKMPEKSNYKINSNNFIIKNSFNKKMKIDEIDQNKVNTILEEIENVQKNDNNCINNININKFDVNINFFDYINSSNINAKFTAFDFNNSLLLSHINNINFNFESKYILL